MGLPEGEKSSVTVELANNATKGTEFAIALAALHAINVSLSEKAKTRGKQPSFIPNMLLALQINLFQSIQVIDWKISPEFLNKCFSAFHAVSGKTGRHS